MPSMSTSGARKIEARFFYRAVLTGLGLFGGVLLSSCSLTATQLAASSADDPAQINQIDAATVESIAIDSEATSSQYAGAPSATGCSLGVARSTCTADSFSVLWSSCELDVGSNALILSGGWSDTFDSSASCSSVQSGQALPSGGQVTRTAAGSFTIALTNGVGLTTDTAAHTTYTGLVLPSTGVSTTVGASSKNIVINGLHRILKTGGGTQLFEQSVVSAGLTVTGSLATADRVVNGSLTTYHDSGSYTAVSTFNNVTWGTATCCFPTSGSISTSLSGTYSGSQSMTFTTPCGQATFIDMTGASSTVALTYCM